MIANNSKLKIADCEVCDASNVAVTIEHGNIAMCADCKASEVAMTAQHKAADMILQETKITETIQVKTDIFISQSPTLVELRGAIEADETIPADQKEYTYAKICKDRFLHLQKVVFEQRQELLARENEMRLWQVNAQEAAGKLKKEAREEFKVLDITYQPNVKETPKPKPGKSPASYKRSELADAAKRHGVPADAIRMTMISRNMSAEDAAKFVSGLMK